MPPLSDLARRTLDFVERAAQERPAVLEIAPAPRRFRLGDFAMAATIFLASLLALAPAVLRGKERWGRAACLNNLQKVGVRLHQYAALNHAYPFVDCDEEVPHAGAILCRLQEAGFPIDPRDLKCPCSESSSKLAPRPPVRRGGRGAEGGARRGMPHARQRLRVPHRPLPLALRRGQGGPAPARRRRTRRSRSPATAPASTTARARSTPATAPTTAARARTSSMPTAMPAGSARAGSARPTTTSTSTTTTDPPTASGPRIRS